MNNCFVKQNCILALLTLLMPLKLFALTIYNNESDFISTGLIISTETFDGFPNNYGFTNKVISIDGVQYRTDQCTNRCWNFDGNNITPPNGLISNAIGFNSIGAGPNRYFDALGFYFLGLGKAGPNFLGWELVITEQDGSLTSLQILPDTVNLSTLAFFGFTSASGISDILLRDNPNDSGASNWILDNVSHGTVYGGDQLPDSTHVPPPGLGGPLGINGVPEPSSNLLILLGLGLMWNSVCRLCRVFPQSPKNGEVN